MGIKAWITINGNHIPIMDGESKMAAVGRFIKGKRKTKKDKRIDEHFEVMDKASHDWAKIERKYNPNISDENLYIKSTDKGYELANSHMENKYGKNWDKYSKHSIKGRVKTSEEVIKDREKKIAEIDKKYEGQKMTRTLQNQKAWEKHDINTKSFGDRYTAKKYEKSYKLKEDKLPKHRQTPVSRIRVDVSEFRNAHGKLPGSNRVGGSTSGNWAFKLGNETIFINDTYKNAKTKALKEASRRGLHSVKVLS